MASDGDYVGEGNLGLSYENLQKAMAPLLEPLAKSADITNLLAKMQTLQEENKALSNSVKMLMDRCEKLESQVNMMYNWKNERNLIIRMKKGVNAEAEKKRAIDTCADLSGIPNILNACDVRVVTGGGGPKSILVATFCDASKVQSVLQNAKKLKGCDISLSRDYPKDVRIKRGHLLKFRKLVMSKSTTRMTLRNDVLSDGETSFKWSPQGLALVSDGNISDALAKYGLTMECIDSGVQSRQVATGRRSVQHSQNQHPRMTSVNDGQALLTSNQIVAGGSGIGKSSY